MSLIFFVACNQDVKKTAPQQDTGFIIQNPNLKLKIYYFHATHRCVTCNSIEANVRQVLESHFKNEMEQGIISLTVLNVDDPANRPLAIKYQAFGSSLHLVDLENGIEIDNDLTEYAFLHSRKQPDFFLQGMSDTISYYIQ